MAQISLSLVFSRVFIVCFPAKKGSLEDKDDISRLVTGLMKTSICRQMSYKTVEGNEVRTFLSLCVPFFGGAGRTVITPGLSAGHPGIMPQCQL